MQILFAISILCLLAIGLAAAALIRHVRVTFTRTEKPQQAPVDFAQHLFAAADGRSARAMRAIPQQTVREIMANKSWNQPPEFVTVRPDRGSDLPLEPSHPLPDPHARKAPQSAHWSGAERLDWAYFSKDLGDLTDPYQVPRLRANSRAHRPPVSRV